jgi:plastocyanin
MRFLFRGRLLRFAPIWGGICFALVGVGGYALAATFAVTLTPTGPQPSIFTAALGDTVTFTNGDSQSHAIVDRSIGLDSPPLGPGQTWTYVLTTSGRLTYSQEGRPNGLGQIVVERTGSVTLKTSRRSVAYGSGAVLSGTSTFTSFPVKIESKGTNDQRWNTVGTVTPAADGSFVLGIQPQIGAQYRATVFDGELLSSLVTVAVRPVVTLAARRRTVAGGSLVTLTARVVPAEAATRLDLARFDAKRQDWKRVLSRTLSDNGRVVFRWRVDYGASLLRAMVASHGVARGFAGAASRAVRVTGTGTPPVRRKHHH